MRPILLIATFIAILCLSVQAFAVGELPYNSSAQQQATEGGSQTPEQQTANKSSRLSGEAILGIIVSGFIIFIMVLIALVKRKNKPSMEFQFGRKF